MVLIILAAVIAAWGLAFASLAPELMRPLLAAAGAALALAVLASAPTRRHLAALLARHAAAALSVLALLALLALAGGAFEGRLHPALRAVAAFAGLALAAGASAAIASAHGRHALAVALLIASIPLAFFALLTDGLALSGPLGRWAPALDAPALAPGFALIALLAIHVGADELRRRPAPGDAALPPLARRLFAPIAALMTSFAMMTLAPAPLALAAAGIGAVSFSGVLWFRARRSRVGAVVAPAVLIASAAAGALAMAAATFGAGERRSLLESAPFHAESGAARWLGEAGWPGAALLALALAALGLILLSGKDRGRSPSRGAPLLASLAACGAFLAAFTPGFDAPAAAYLLATLIGLAASYLDLPAAARTPRSRPPR